MADPPTFPSGFVPFTSIYYISGVDWSGNFLVEGIQTVDLFDQTRLLPAPTAPNQQFSNASIELAPGQFFSNVYIPTAAELGGNFSATSLPVLNPPASANQAFPGNEIPGSVIGGLFVFMVGPQPGPPLNFVPVTSCRVADTRTASGPFGAPFLAAYDIRPLNIPSSNCNIPNTASAYSLNVTVVPHGELGYLTLWPTGQIQPLVSTLNSDGRVKANAAITPAGDNGAVSFSASNDTDLIVDINGYFVPATTNTGLSFYPLPPCRIADTRNANGSLGGPALAAGKYRDLPVLRSTCNLPSSAQAYSLNFTAIPQEGLG